MVASHVQLTAQGEASILEEHMPANHRLYNSLSPSSIKQWAKSNGDAVYAFVEQILNRSKQLARNINSLNKLRDYILENRLDSVLNQACEYALRYKLLAVTDLIYVLKNKRYITSIDTSQIIPSPQHTNLRGAEYFGGVR